MSAANALLQAIHAILSTDPALTALIGPDGIRDRLVSGKRLPAVVIAVGTARGAGHIGHRHRPAAGCGACASG